MGRDFESLRDYQETDILRDISWTATARRGRPIARQFTTERSQQVWLLLDAGRLSRSNFLIRGSAMADIPLEPYTAGHDPAQQPVTQLDLATSTAMLLA